MSISECMAIGACCMRYLTDQFLSNCPALRLGESCVHCIPSGVRRRVISSCRSRGRGAAPDEEERFRLEAQAPPAAVTRAHRRRLLGATGQTPPESPPHTPARDDGGGPKRGHHGRHLHLHPSPPPRHLPCLGTPSSHHARLSGHMLTRPGRAHATLPVSLCTLEEVLVSGFGYRRRQAAEAREGDVERACQAGGARSSGHSKASPTTRIAAFDCRSALGRFCALAKAYLIECLAHLQPRDESVRGTASLRSACAQTGQSSAEDRQRFRIHQRNDPPSRCITGGR